MKINKPSVTKTEAADRVNLLDSTKPDQMLASLPRYVLFHDSHQKDSCFQTWKLNIR